MATYYRVDVEDPFFNPLVKINDYLSLSLTDSNNQEGPATLQVPLDYLDKPFGLGKPDLILAIMESTDGSPWRLHRNTKWFVEGVDIAFENKQWFLEIQATDALGSLLGRRTDPYYAASSSSGYVGQAQSQIAGTYADNMAKNVIRYNLGTLATDYTQLAGVIAIRQLPPALFTVDPDTSEGAVLGTKGIAWRNGLIGPCQELAAASFENGTYLSFDIVMDRGKLAFRTFPNQRGRDHSGSASKVITLTPQNGLSQARLSVSYKDEVNAVYCGGQGDGNARIVSPAQIDLARSTLSPWAYREAFVDARGGGTAAAAVLAEAQGALIAGRPVYQLTGTITETPTLRYGMDGEIFYGDKVLVSFMGKQFVCRLEQVSVTAVGGQPAVPTINLRSV